jgi:hypothetical protein
MEPMKPMSGGEKWWPEDLGQPSTSGSQNGMRYAFFPENRRLLTEQGGKLTTYDSGDHRISGVSQQQSQGQSLAFTDQNGSASSQCSTSCPSGHPRSIQIPCARSRTRQHLSSAAAFISNSSARSEIA